MIEPEGRNTAPAILAAALHLEKSDPEAVMLVGQLSTTCPQATFVPEIWQGHKNNGAGFWYALDKMEQWYKATT